jgi:hypothetical protein
VTPKIVLVAALVFVGTFLACGGGRIGAGTAATASFAESKSFTAGIAHVAGNYGFTHENYLLEGAKRIQQLGSKSIFVYLTSHYAQQYPDRGAGMWSKRPSSLAELAQATPYAKLFAMPFNTFVLTAYTFANDGQIEGMSSDRGRQQAEEDEFYALAKYLYGKYAGSGKNFILKNWEGDWIGLRDYNASKDIAPSRIADMVAWLSARERGVERARNEVGSTDTSVLNAVEVNRVLDYAQHGSARVINKVVPQVKPDMVTYSSYDSTSQRQDAASVAKALNLALNTIEKLAPDPLSLGSRRILISEYGMFENQQPGDAWRADAILKTAKSAGIAGAFLWNVFDNECVQGNGQPAGVGLPPGAWGRPQNGQCRGLWAIRPDGSTSQVVGVLKKYF